jgi:hypothetical protein
MPGLDPGIHRAASPWIAGSSPAMTKGFLGGIAKPNSVAGTNHVFCWAVRDRRIKPLILLIYLIDIDIQIYPQCLL